MEDWSNERMGDEGRETSSMSDGTGSALEAQTAALVRVAAAVAGGVWGVACRGWARAGRGRRRGRPGARRLGVVDGARSGGVPRGVRACLSQAAREPARAAPGTRGPGGGGRLRQGDRAAGPRPQAA